MESLSNEELVKLKATDTEASVKFYLVLKSYYSNKERFKDMVNNIIFINVEDVEMPTSIDFSYKPFTPVEFFKLGCVLYTNENLLKKTPHYYNEKVSYFDKMFKELLDCFSNTHYHLVYKALLYDFQQCVRICQKSSTERAKYYKEQEENIHPRRHSASGSEISDDDDDDEIGKKHHGGGGGSGGKTTIINGFIDEDYNKYWKKRIFVDGTSRIFQGFIYKEDDGFQLDLEEDTEFALNLDPDWLKTDDNWSPIMSERTKRVYYTYHNGKIFYISRQSPVELRQIISRVKYENPSPKEEEEETKKDEPPPKKEETKKDEPPPKKDEPPPKKDETSPARDGGTPPPELENEEKAPPETKEKDTFTSLKTWSTLTEDLQNKYVKLFKDNILISFEPVLLNTGVKTAEKRIDDTKIPVFIDAALNFDDEPYNKENFYPITNYLLYSKFVSKTSSKEEHAKKKLIILTSIVLQKPVEPQLFISTFMNFVSKEIDNTWTMTSEFNMEVGASLPEFRTNKDYISYFIELMSNKIFYVNEFKDLKMSSEKFVLLDYLYKNKEEIEFITQDRFFEDTFNREKAEQDMVSRLKTEALKDTNFIRLIPEEKLNNFIMAEILRYKTQIPKNLLLFLLPESTYQKIFRYSDLNYLVIKLRKHIFKFIIIQILKYNCYDKIFVFLQTIASLQFDKDLKTTNPVFLEAGKLKSNFLFAETYTLLELQNFIEKNIFPLFDVKPDTYQFSLDEAKLKSSLLFKRLPVKELNEIVQNTSEQISYVNFNGFFNSIFTLKSGDETNLRIYKYGFTNEKVKFKPENLKRFFYREFLMLYYLIILSDKQRKSFLNQIEDFQREEKKDNEIIEFLKNIKNNAFKV